MPPVQRIPYKLHHESSKITPVSTVVVSSRLKVTKTLASFLLIGCAFHDRIFLRQMNAIES